MTELAILSVAGRKLASGESGQGQDYGPIASIHQYFGTLRSQHK